MVLAHNINEGGRTQDVQITEDVTFDTMLLAAKTRQGLANSGFHKPSPIQLHAIPLGKCGFDLLLEAKSGTGKTGVFTVIALEKLDLRKDLQTLILAPTREIAAQICDVIKQIGSSYRDLKIEVVMGGLPVQEDIAKFKEKVHIAVGSPGRLRHLIQDHHINISSVRLLVLDEADKLMDKSFQADINYIFSVLPKQKQVIMSSATYPETLMTVMKKYVKNAQHICPETTSVLLGIKQLVTLVKSNTNIVTQTQYRFEELLKILSKKQFKQCLIFCNYQVRVRELSKMLLKEKWPAQQLHGQQEQSDRLDALKTLQEYKCRILIATDLAARGIDASNVDLVINFEPPYDWQTYLHRIGRAGRYGSYGLAITILSKGQEDTTFHKMISTINGSLELKNLWDDEKYDLDHSDVNSDTKASFSTTASETLVIDDNKNVMSAVKPENMKGIEEMQNREKIFKSFEKAKECDIVSFSDLLTSFESHKVLEKSEIKNSISNQLIYEMDKLCVIDKKEDISIIKSNVSHNNENINLNINDLYENHNEKNTQGIMQTQNERPRDTSQYNDNKVIALNNFGDDHITKALIENGLPTSFSSKPKTKSYTSREKRCYNNNKHQVRRKKYSKTMAEPTSENNSGSDDCEDDVHSTKSCSVRKSCNLNDYLNKKQNNCNINLPTQYKIKDNNDELNSHLASQKEYALWYSKLKAHVNQLQMALYIDEMTKTS